mmetsp:Transcript_10340/g.30962  ORF Transcript_10340/g.30962 Transcript_10340/m.30962 type:complete len:421 (-) Transcript_10340:1226-2488(-)
MEWDGMGRWSRIDKCDDFSTLRTPSERPRPVTSYEKTCCAEHCRIGFTCRLLTTPRLLSCRQGTLQFVVLKPIMGILSLVMLAQGLYFMRAFQVTMLVVYNISYTLALYCLWLFYQATHNLLERHKPILKFVAIKGMVFATYWQGVAVKLSPGISQTDAILWNNFILCVEMVFFSGLLLLAFGVDEYKRKNVHGLGVVSTDLWANFRDVISVRDLVADAYHNFVPAYQDYVLQTNVEDGEEPVRYRARTFLIGNLDADTMMASASKGEGEGEKPSARQPSGPTIEMKNGFGNENEEEEDIEMEFTMPMRTSNFTGPKFRSPLHRTNSLGAQAHQKMVDPEKSKGIMGTLGETLKVPGIPFLKKEESKDAEPDAFDGFGGTEVSDDIDMHLAFTGDSFSVVDDSAFVDEPLSEDRKIEVVL